MSDIHQEWRELRKKNGDFINHLDGEMAKIEKKQVELKRREQTQDMADAGAFAMQFVTPPPFNCCQDDRDILKALNKAQADRIKALEDELLACKEQRQVDLAVKKDLDEKLDKAAADYKALWVEKEDLKERAVNSNKVNVALHQRNDWLREKISNLEIQNRQLKHAIPSVNTYAQQGMQSKIAKQANEIKRLTEENERLKYDNKALDNSLSDQTKRVMDLQSARATLKHEIDTLHGALDIAAKDAEANFERGKIKGMQEIWAALQWAQDKIEGGFLLMPIYGYYSMADCVNSLTATAFLRKTVEWQEKEARDIKIGDEVEIFVSHDHSLSDIGIVIAIDNDNPCFAVIGPNFEGCFDETDIQSGTVKKTGNHYDAIPLDYFS